MWEKGRRRGIFGRKAKLMAVRTNSMVGVGVGEAWAWGRPGTRHDEARIRDKDG